MIEHTLKIETTAFDLTLLPDEAQHELFEFYEFLVFKYHHKGNPPIARETSEQTKKSKWANIVQRIHNDPVHLAGYSEQLQQDMHTFRETFAFLHDTSQ